MPRQSTPDLDSHVFCFLGAAEGGVDRRRVLGRMPLTELELRQLLDSDLVCIETVGVEML